jgi:ankyrin repeat protein
MSKGADPKIVTKQGRTVIHKAAINDITLPVLFFQNKIDIDQKDNLGMTALIYSASVCAPATTQYLLALGADPNAVDNQGRTAMHHSLIELDKFNFYQVKNRGGKTDIVDKFGYIPIDYIDETSEDYEELID